MCLNQRYTPPGHWNAIAEQVAAQQGNSLADNARLFAELDIALADAAVVAWDAKYHYNAWRPIAAIEDAASTGNTQVAADPTWTPLLNTPPFPEYISGHSTFSGAAATVLDSLLGSSVAFSTTSQTLVGVTRSYTSFDQAAAEAGQSRIYGGIHFQFSNQDGLAAGKALGNYVLNAFSVTSDTAPPVVVFTGNSSGLVINHNLTITGQALDQLSGVATLQVKLDDGPLTAVSFDGSGDGGTTTNPGVGGTIGGTIGGTNGGTTGEGTSPGVSGNGLGNFHVQTTFALDGTADGRHVFHFIATDAAGNVSAPIDFVITLDTKAPTLTLTSPIEGGNIQGSATLSGAVDGNGSALIAFGYAFDGGTLTPIALPEGTDFSTPLDLSKLSLGMHSLVVTAVDAAGNTTNNTVNVNLSALNWLKVLEVTPADGAVDQGVTVRPKIVFSRPINPTTLNSNNLFATDASGARLPATIVPSNDGTYAWLFLTNPMPGGATITLTVDGSSITAVDGALLDAAANGTPGSKRVTTFATVNQTPFPGTSLTGILADPGPDLQPGTYDDTRAGPDLTLNTADDVYLLPIAGAKVYILGHEDQAVLTDSHGRFTLSSVPAGDVKLAIDGRTATNAPAGFYFPEMVMDLNVHPGVVNTVMGSMGSTDEQTALAKVQGVELPRLRTSLLRPVDAADTTHIGVDALSAPNLTPDQQQLLSIDVQPNSLVGPDGRKLATGQIGISTVPPDLVRDMLPPGLLQHTFDITVQAPGITTFSTPAPMTFPNVFHALPGTQLNFLSFDHTTGRLVIEGTATVSADGLSVHTDPGTGITHPGWHGLASGGGKTKPHDLPKDKPTKTVVPDFVVANNFHDYLFTKDSKDQNGQTFNFDFGNAAGSPVSPTDPTIQVDLTATPLIIDITIDGPADDFLKGLVPQKIVLYPGEQTSLAVKVKNLLTNPATVENDALYGVTVTFDGKYGDPHDAASLKDLFHKQIYIYRYVDAEDTTHDDGIIDFPGALNDGQGNVQRTRNIQFHLGASTTPTFKFADNQNFSFATGPVDNSFVFDPTVSQKQITTTFQVISPDNKPVGDPLTVRGDGTDRQKIFVNKQGLIDDLKQIFDGNANQANIIESLVTDTEKKLFATPNDRNMLANLVETRIKDHFAAFAAGVEFVDVAGPDTTQLNWTTTPVYGRNGGSFDSNPNAIEKFLGIDNKTSIMDVFNGKTSTAVERFKLANALNQSTKANIEIYPDSVLEWKLGVPYNLTLSQFVEVLATTASHELAHSFGVLHTAQKTLPDNFASEVQQINLTGGGKDDTFTLTFDGQTTDKVNQIKRDAAPGDVEKALQQLKNIGFGQVHVTSPQPGVYVVMFTTNLAATNVPEMTGTGTGTLAVPVITTTEGYAIEKLDSKMGKLDVINLNGVLGTNDIMFGGHFDLGGVLTFQEHLSAPALRMGLKMGWTKQDASDVLDFYNAQNDVQIFSESDVEIGPGISEPRLSITDANGHLFGNTSDLGTVRVDGPGGELASATWSLTNSGGQDLVLNHITIVDPTGSFTGTSIPAGTILSPGQSLPFTVTFDPQSVSGDINASVSIDSSSSTPTPDIQLHGFGLSPNGDVRLSVPNNNVGGLKLSSPLVYEHGFGAIHNIGDRPLTITNVAVAGGSDQFELFGLPGGLSAAHPYILAPGQTLNFDLTFDAKYLGLQRAEIQVFTDDPETPIVTQGVVGTGLADVDSALSYGHDYVALETTFVPGSPVLRQTSDANGNWSFFLPQQTAIHYVIFDPVSGLVAHGYAVTAASGQTTKLLAPFFEASTAPDSDGDGLPDDIEFAIGTSPKKVDTDGDGLSDFVQIQAGLDPLGGKAFPTGVVANVQVQGQALSIVVKGSILNNQGNTAYVAAGDGGLALLDVSKTDKPLVLSQLALPGSAVDVDVDENVQVAAVAARFGGLHLVDVSDRLHPRLLRTIDIFASHVKTFAGVAYVTVGTGLQAYDLKSGEALPALDFHGDTLFSMARENNFLYLVGGNQLLHIVEIKGLQMIARGTLQLSDTSSDLVVGNGIAYAMASSSPQGGYSTIDVSNPDQPTLISGTDVVAPNAFPRSWIALTGSGKAALLGRINGGTLIDPAVLTLVNSADPQTTNTLLTQFNLTGTPQGVAIASGIAFVPEGAGGIEVVNFLPFDSAGIAPTVSIVPQVADGDPNLPGIQVLEGTSIPVKAIVQDDVQVRDVQLLVDGQPTQSAVSFPFNLEAIAPRRNGQKTSFTLQVRATDTGGNSTLSAPVTIDLLPDVTPPTIVKIDPSEGEKKLRDFRTLHVTFSEAMAAADVTAANFQVFDANNVLVNPVDVGLRGDDKIVQISFNDLKAGDYRLVIHSADVHDRAGNTLVGHDVTTHFSIDPYSLRFQFNKSSDFLDPANWDQGRIPGPNDYVLIDVPNGFPVQFQTFGAFVHPHAAITIAGMTVNTPFSIELGGDLTITDTLQLNSTLVLNDGILHETTIVAGPGAAISTVPVLNGDPFIDDFGNPATLDGVTVHGHVDASTAFGVTIINGLTLNGIWNGGELNINRQTTFIDGVGTFEDTRIITEKGRSLTLGERIAVRGQYEIDISDGTSITNKGTIASDRAGVLTQIRVSLGNDGATVAGILINEGTIEATNGGTMQIVNETVTPFYSIPRFVLANNGVLHAGAGSLLVLDDFEFSSKLIVADAGSTVLLAARLQTPAGKTSTLSGPGTWLVNGRCFGPETYTLPNIDTTMFTGGTVNLTGGAKLKGSILLNNVIVNGDIELTDTYPIPAVVGYIPTNGNDVIIIGNVQINGVVTLGGVQDTFATHPRDAFEAHLVGAGHGAVLGGRASIQFSSTPGNALGVVQRFSEFTLGASVFVVGSHLHIGTIGAITNSTFTNHATITLSDGNVLIDGSWANPDGQISISDSIVTLGGVFTPADLVGLQIVGGTVNLSGAVYSYDQTLALDFSTGSWNLLGGVLTTATGVRLVGTTTPGVLNGVTINGLVDLPGVVGVRINATLPILGTGTLRIGSGAVFSVSDTYTQKSTGTLAIAIGGPPGSGLNGTLTVAGTAALDGTLTLSLANGYTPMLGDVFTIITAGNFQGTFATITGTDLGNGMRFQVSYSAAGVTLTVVSNP